MFVNLLSLVLFLIAASISAPAFSSDAVIPQRPATTIAGQTVAATPPVQDINDKYNLKLAYGRTFGTSTPLDYATFEFSRKLKEYANLTDWGPTKGEVQMALIASYVVYYEGNVERIKKLDFHDGYEVGWVPKGKFSFSESRLGLAPFLESGAGLSYVSETYRNSGSRWNWSLLGGMGFEKSLGSGALSFGMQWRHLSNGNMWGRGDELHNSNSGTDMVQGLAMFKHTF